MPRQAFMPPQQIKIAQAASPLTPSAPLCRKSPLLAQRTREKWGTLGGTAAHKHC
jgi:hypothetical protein